MSSHNRRTRKAGLLSRETRGRLTAHERHSQLVTIVQEGISEHLKQSFPHRVRPEKHITLNRTMVSAYLYGSGDLGWGAHRACASSAGTRFYQRIRRTASKQQTRPVYSDRSSGDKSASHA
ncbi:hypothetical protein Trydic_g23385 [Trypoxylus dichotomus]